MIFHNAVKKILTAPPIPENRTLERLSFLFRELHLPSKGLLPVLITGESGKSATATMLAHALTSQKVPVGCLTTPFSYSITECITLNGQPISMEDFTRCVNRVCETITTIREKMAAVPETDGNDPLTAYEQALRTYRRQDPDLTLSADELLLSVALLYFSENRCRVAILEVPCGERSAAYHLPVTPALNVITSTEDATLAEKACLFPGKQVRETVTAIQEKAINDVILNGCVKLGCRRTITLKSKFYTVEMAAQRMRLYYNTIPYTFNSGAYYQAMNLLTVIEALGALKRLGLAVDPLSADFHAGFSGAGLPGQFSVLSLLPTVVCDTADTLNRIKAFAQALTYHRERLGIEATVFIEELPHIKDSDIIDCFTYHGLPAPQILRGPCAIPADMASLTPLLRRTLRPLAKQLTPESSLYLLGSRPFVYEVSRLFRDLLS